MTMAEVVFHTNTIAQINAQFCNCEEILVSLQLAESMGRAGQIICSYFHIVILVQSGWSTSVVTCVSSVDQE